MDMIRELMDFLDASLTCYHAVREVERKLTKAGFTRLSEKAVWQLEGGRGYYVIRNDSSLAAFRVQKCGVDTI